MQDTPGLQKLLSRTNLQIPFENFLEEVKKEYNLGKIYSYFPILEGYENANIKIDTEKGKFVIKIFSKDVSDFEVESNVKVINESLKIGVPLTRLLEGKNGFLQKLSQSDKTLKYLLMYFFDGPSFEEQPLTMKDIVEVTRFLAKLNSFNFPVVSTYDSWGNKNLIKEYIKHKGKVSKEVKEVIDPNISDLSQIDFSGFSQSVIHGDLQRKHVMKNSKGEYCILDLGCMRNDARIYDVSIHLAWFCLGQNNWNDRDKIVKNVIDEYTKIHPLNQAELNSIFVLIKAAYAAYLLKTSLLIQDGDTSNETRQWYRNSKEMLSKCSEWKWV